MAVKLRLTRFGAKKFPFYRIVAVDSREKRDGNYLELLGTYNPLTKPEEVKLNEELIIKWLKNGAIPTDTVRVIFSKAGIMKKFHEQKAPKAKKVEKEPVNNEEAKVKKETTKKTTTKKTTKKVGK